MPAHDEFDDFFPDDDAPVVDTRADGRLLRVPLARLSPNLVNPRTDFGTEDDLIDFGKSLSRRQVQACPVVSRSAYLKLWPDHAEQIGKVDYVIVSGERRFRGATAVGLAALTCVVDDGIAQDRKTFMEAVVSENVDRQNFDPVEEAYAVQALVSEFGSNRAVAQHFERADGWVTQRILLTHLAPEVQVLVRQKQLPLERARSLGKLARDEEWDSSQQLDWWAQEQQARKAASEARQQEKKARSFTAVKQQTPPAPVPEPEAKPQPAPPAPGPVARPLPVPSAPTPQPTGEGSPRESETAAPVPEPRTNATPSVPPTEPQDGQQDGPAQSALEQEPHGGDPWETIPSLVQYIVARLPPSDVLDLTARLQQHNRSRLGLGRS